MATAVVTRDMNILQILTLYPFAGQIMTDYGLHCVNCHFSELDTLEDAAPLHGLTDEHIDEMIADINKAIEHQPERPKTIAITEKAARAIGQIAASQGKQDEGLEVLLDEHGGFFLEFRKEPAKDQKIFFHKNQPSVRFFASPSILARVGGATIDYRDNRFKLDVEGTNVCGCNEASCQCK